MTRAEQAVEYASNSISVYMKLMCLFQQMVYLNVKKGFFSYYMHIGKTKFILCQQLPPVSSHRPWLLPVLLELLQHDVFLHHLLRLAHLHRIDLYPA